MVLLKPEDKQRLEQMRQQCGQERDLQIKQVENGFIIQAVTRFFVDQGSGPVQAGEMSDTTIAVTAYEAGTIAGNYMRHGEFWPESEKNTLDGVDEYYGTGSDPVMEALMPEQHSDDQRKAVAEHLAATRERITRDVEPGTGYYPPHTKPMDAFDRETDDATD